MHPFGMCRVFQLPTSPKFSASPLVIQPLNSMSSYHNECGNDIIDNQSKSCIFDGLGYLWLSGSLAHPRSSEKPPSENCTFHLVFNELVRSVAAQAPAGPAEISSEALTVPVRRASLQPIETVHDSLSIERVPGNRC